MKLSKSQALAEHFWGEGEAVNEHFCCLFSWPPRLVDFLINSLYGKSIFAPVLRGSPALAAGYA